MALALAIAAGNPDCDGEVAVVASGRPTLQLSGSYFGDIFTAAPDGRGGTAITLGAAATEPPPVHAFVAAMAGMTASPAAAHASAGLPITVSHPTLVAPRAALA